MLAPGSAPGAEHNSQTVVSPWRDHGMVEGVWSVDLGKLQLKLRLEQMISEASLQTSQVQLLSKWPLRDKPGPPRSYPDDSGSSG